LRSLKNLRLFEEFLCERKLAGFFFKENHHITKKRRAINQQDGVAKI